MVYLILKLNTYQHIIWLLEIQNLESGLSHQVHGLSDLL